MSEDSIVLLPLDGERRVTVHQGKHAYTYFFPRLTAEHWRKVFEQLTVSTEPDTRGNTRQRIDTLQAGVDLVRSTVTKVTGYDGNIEDLPNWRSLLPSMHVRAVAADLQNVSVDPGDDSKPVSLMGVEVSLSASWNVGDERRVFSGLTHRFAAPTAEHERRYLRAMSETVVEPGGRTIFPSRHLALLTIYDELIQSVDGYSVNGVPLGDRESVVREMDRAHKVCAAGALFRQAADVAE